MLFHLKDEDLVSLLFHEFTNPLSRNFAARNVNAVDTQTFALKVDSGQF